MDWVECFKFSFIPSEKLARLGEVFLNPAKALPEYVMDLTWVSYRKDYNYSGQIKATESSKASNDKVWLYGGMRMGGKNYYALDVTDITTPKLMFGIEGMVRVMRYIEALVVDLNDNGKLEFTKTIDTDSDDVPRFKVTLGVVPDYLSA